MAAHVSRRFALGRAVKSNWGHPLQTGNNTPLLSNITGAKPLWLLNNQQFRRMLVGMKRTLVKTLSVSVIGTFLVLGSAHAASAGCYADYKAKQDDPLKLHYGVAELSGDCSVKAAQAELAPRVATEGWTLLTVLSVFGDEGLQERKESAGRYFLRY